MIDRRVLIGLVSSVSELVAVLLAFEEVPGSNLGSESQGVGRGGKGRGGMGGATTAGGGRNLAGLALFTKLGCQGRDLPCAFFTLAPWDSSSCIRGKLDILFLIKLVIYWQTPWQ